MSQSGTWCSRSSTSHISEPINDKALSTRCQISGLEVEAKPKQTNKQTKKQTKTPYCTLPPPYPTPNHTCNEAAFARGGTRDGLVAAHVPQGRLEVAWVEVSQERDGWRKCNHLHLPAQAGFSGFLGGGELLVGGRSGVFKLEKEKLRGVVFGGSIVLGGICWFPMVL